MMCMNVTICVTFYYIITQKHKIENLKHTTKTSLPYFDKEVTHIYAVLTFLFASRSSYLVL